MRSLSNNNKNRSSQFQQPRRPKPQILSPEVTRVTLGGTLNLECVVSEDPRNSDISWWLNGTKFADFAVLHRGGVHISTRHHQNTSATCKLIVVEFKHADAGLYECRVEKPGHFNANVARANVHVTVIDPSKTPPPDPVPFSSCGDNDNSDTDCSRAVDLPKHRFLWPMIFSAAALIQP